VEEALTLVVELPSCKEPARLHVNGNEEKLCTPGMTEETVSGSLNGLQTREGAHWKPII
jgi:hypothetical protein